MPYTPRVGVRLGSADPFWVQTRESLLRHSQQFGVELVPIDLRLSTQLTSDEQLAIVEGLLAQELDAVICSYLPEELLFRILKRGLPVVQLTEAQIRHPLFVAPQGFYDIARVVGGYLAEQLNGRGQVLIAGGLLAGRGEDGRSRIAGVSDALCAVPEMVLHHIPSAWRYEHAYPQILEGMREYGARPDAVFGLSDSLALAARDAGRALGIIDERTLIVGINGDPLALAAVAEGSMAATVDTPADEFGRQALTLACQAARREPLPDHFGYAPQLVTAANVSEIALQKLIAIAELPNRLVGINRRQEQQRLTQLELSLEINRRIGAILDRDQLSQEISELIRVGYGYDRVQLFHWLEQEQSLVPDHANRTRLSLAESGMLKEALERNELIYVPDTQHSHRFPPDPRWPDARSRVVVPVRFGGAILGLLDMHNRRVVQHTRESLAGLQLLADQLGIAMRNADLYSKALEALAMAEKADQLKTRLLANVSHELRTPLNVILGYSQAALSVPNSYGAELPLALRHDLQQIYRSGEHLIRVINDLLDLSRAEIGELELVIEPIDTRSFLIEVFESIAAGLDGRGTLRYQLQLPDRLPMIQADPVRLRQILLNLLSNAHKFTEAGSITLGAELLSPYLHIWVEDTGIGIPAELQEEIFAPFATDVQRSDCREGVGLGLSITRRLVALHRGMITLESQPNRGSTFHVYLPLPSLAGQATTAPSSGRPAVLLISTSGRTPAPVAELSRRQGMEVFHLRSQHDVRGLLDQHRPVALAWDVAEAEPQDWLQIQQLRADPRLCQLPFIVYGREEVPGAAVGATGIVSKPLYGSTLLETIESLLPSASVGPVLIVDDDQDARKLYRDVVQQALPGLPVRLVDGGGAALEVLQQEVPGLVLLDLAMPDVDGFTVLQRVRGDQRTRHVPVLILSGKLLSLDDVKRLDHALVTFQSKDVLLPTEAVAALRTSFAGQDALAQPTSRIVKHAVAYIHQHYTRVLTRQEIADAVGVSKNYLTQIFHHELGISPWEYLNRFRVREAKILLRETSDSITAVADQVGFNDASYFGRIFRKQVGCSPQSYREHGARGSR